MNGIDLDSLLEIWKETGKMYTESDFSTFTAVYNASLEIQNLIEPFKDHIARSHILNLPPGGYFPPHRDTTAIKEPNDFRIIIPLKRCNPPDMYFMYDDKPLPQEDSAAKEKALSSCFICGVDVELACSP